MTTGRFTKMKVKKKSLFTLLAFLTLLVLVLGYHFISPKIALTNLSKQKYDELRIELPSSNVSFGPIELGDNGTIYFSFQDQEGLIKYKLSANGMAVNEGALPYPKGNELALKLSFVIDESGNIMIAY